MKYTYNVPFVDKIAPEPKLEKEIKQGIEYKYYTIKDLMNKFPFNKIKILDDGFVRIPAFYFSFGSVIDNSYIEFIFSDEETDSGSRLQAFKDTKGEGYCEYVDISIGKIYSIVDGKIDVTKIWHEYIQEKDVPSVDEFKVAMENTYGPEYIDADKSEWNRYQLYDYGIHTMLSILYCVACSCVDRAGVPPYGTFQKENPQPFHIFFSDFKPNRILSIIEDAPPEYNVILGMGEFIGNTLTYIDRVRQKVTFNSNVWLFEYSPNKYKSFKLTDQEQTWWRDDRYTIPMIGWSGITYYNEDLQYGFDYFHSVSNGGSSAGGTQFQRHINLTNPQNGLNNKLYYGHKLSFSYTNPLFLGVNVSDSDVHGYRICRRVKRTVLDYKPTLSKIGFNKLEWNTDERVLNYDLYKNGKLYKEFKYPDNSTIIEPEDTKSVWRIVAYNSFDLPSNYMFPDNKSFVESNSIETIGFFNINLYHNNSETNRVVKNLEFVDTIVGVLRDECDILNPVLLIEYDFERDFPNYIYIEKFKRYYYITDYTVVRNGLWRINCAVDVLMSHKDDILKQTALVSRNEFIFNDMMVDNNIIVNKEPKFELIYSEDFGISGDESYILTVVGASSYGVDGDMNPKSSWLLRTYSCNYKAVERILSRIYEPNFWELVSDAFAGDPTGAIVSIVWYPTQVSSAMTEALEEIVIPGGSNITFNTDSEICKQFTRSRLIEIDSNFFRISVEHFYDYSPYSMYKMYIPFVGFIDFDDAWLNKHLFVRYVINVDINTATAVLMQADYNEKGALEPKTSLKMFSCSLGRSVPISRSNSRELFQKYVKTAISVATTAAGAAIGIGAAAGAVGTLAAGGSSTAAALAEQQLGATISKGAVDTLKSSTMGMMQTSSNFAGGDINDPLGYYSVGISAISVLKSSPTIVEPEGYAHFYGRPLNSTELLDNLHGFTLVSEIHLDNVKCSSTELGEIERILYSGVILPE